MEERASLVTVLEAKLKQQKSESARCRGLLQAKHDRMAAQLDEAEELRDATKQQLEALCKSQRLGEAHAEKAHAAVVETLRLDGGAAKAELQQCKTELRQKCTQLEQYQGSQSMLRAAVEAMQRETELQMRGLLAKSVPECAAAEQMKLLSQDELESVFSAVTSPPRTQGSVAAHSDPSKGPMAVEEWRQVLAVLVQSRGELEAAKWKAANHDTTNGAAEARLADYEKSVACYIRKIKQLLRNAPMPGEESRSECSKLISSLEQTMNKGFHG